MAVVTYLHVNASNVIVGKLTTDRAPVLAVNWTLLDASLYPGADVMDVYDPATNKVTRPAAIQNVINASKLIV